MAALIASVLRDTRERHEGSAAQGATRHEAEGVA
jgi:hypothetical protein